MGTIVHVIDEWPRFVKHVDQRGPADCWVWTGARDRDGYGQFKLGGQVMKAHRLSFWFAHDRWPEPEARHTCDNPPCVNPHHLEEGTRSDNMRDRADRGHQAGGRQSSDMADWSAEL